MVTTPDNACLHNLLRPDQQINSSHHICPDASGIALTPAVCQHAPRAAAENSLLARNRTSITNMYRQTISWIGQAPLPPFQAPDDAPNERSQTDGYSYTTRKQNRNSPPTPSAAMPVLPSCTHFALSSQQGTGPSSRRNRCNVEGAMNAMAHEFPLCPRMPLEENARRRCRARLRRLALVESDELLLELREEILPSGHEVRHVACIHVTQAMLHRRYSDIPRDPQAPLLLFATESPCTLWYADRWSAALALVPVADVDALFEEDIPATVSRYSAAHVRGSSRSCGEAPGCVAKLCAPDGAPLPALCAYSFSRTL